MKKIFINPEIETVELTPAENIMALDLAQSAEGQTSSVVYTDTEVSAEFNKWKGFNN